MNVSIVIPVYNEAERLAVCLEAIGRQSVKPFEVFVVDNNSTDGSVRVAESFDFVTVVRESKQGVLHARNRGFDLAKAEIIGRIDADTLLPPDWVRNVLEIFASRQVSAVSGSAHYYDFALDKLADRIDGRLRGYLAGRLGKDNFLWGANMAVRKSDWQRVRNNLCARGTIHEDFDLGIHLERAGLEVIYRPELNAGVSSRRVDTGFRSYVRYSLVAPQTYAAHQLKRGRHMYPVLAFCWAIYLPARLIYRSYNNETERFSVVSLVNGTKARIDPSSNIV